MMRYLMAVVLGIGLSQTAVAQKLTLEQARECIPRRELPAFWLTDAAQLSARWQRLERGEVQVLAQSPGARPVQLVTFGPRETVGSEANFNAAVAAREPAAFVDKAARRRPVVLFVGPVHGQETEGLVSLVNFIEVMETGRDLKGREQADLRRLGDACRLLIVPIGNPDGLARFEPKSSWGMTMAESEFWGMGTWADDTIADWPKSKVPHPHVGPKIGFRGCYFNDAGINPMHDEFFVPMSSEAPAILRVAREEGPDLAVSLHSHSAAPALLRPAYVPIEVQDNVATLAKRCYAKLEQQGLPYSRPFASQAESGRWPAPFNLVSALISRERRYDVHLRVPPRSDRRQRLSRHPGSDSGHPSAALHGHAGTGHRVEGRSDGNRCLQANALGGRLAGAAEEHAADSTGSSPG